VKHAARIAARDLQESGAPSIKLASRAGCCDPHGFSAHVVLDDASIHNPKKHPTVKKEFGQQFIDWLTAPNGQKAIADYKIDGRRLFYPNANDPKRMTYEQPIIQHAGCSESTPVGRIADLPRPLQLFMHWPCIRPIGAWGVLVCS
jgi:hypothetical protein